MVEIGKFQMMKISNISSVGAYLDAETGNSKDNILLPNNQLLKGVQEGDDLEVFIYRDSKDRLIATRRKPLAQVGELAYLKVAQITKIGAFLEWGLEKDLLLPFSEQKYTVRKGKHYLVAVYVDKSDRLCATTDIYSYLQTDSPYNKNDLVKGTVYRMKREIGAMVAVDNKYYGMIPENEYFQAIKVGDQVETRVIRVREDGKLDLSMQKLAYQQMDEDAEMLLDTIDENDGLLFLNDDSTPEAIRSKLGMSKRAFKRAVGKLLKQNKIEQTEKGLKRK